MSEKVARLAVNQLRKVMFPALPQDIQDLIPKVTDQLVSPTEQVPNIVVGQYLDFGANAAMPMVTVCCEGPTDGIVNQYRHIGMHVDVWAGGAQSSNVDNRRIVSILYEYIRRTLQNVNWSGNQIQIERCYEIERSEILIEPQNKIYHVSILFRVEALSQVWY